MLPFPLGTWLQCFLVLSYATQLSSNPPADLCLKYNYCLKSTTSTASTFAPKVCTPDSHSCLPRQLASPSNPSGPASSSTNDALQHPCWPQLTCCLHNSLIVSCVVYFLKGCLVVSYLPNQCRAIVPFFTKFIPWTQNQIPPRLGSYHP